MNRYPFEYDPSRPFVEQAAEWIGDVFYDVLPEAGFEIRDEQIYMAYQLERAFAEKKPIFAEAGVGTGKTLVYLLYSICYARYTGKPAVIACADESLIEQLVKPEGDVAKLAGHLNLQIDARLAKSPDQYLCLNKLHEAQGQDKGQLPLDDLYASLPRFVYSPEGMQEFQPYGDRKNYPDLSDEQWGHVNWDSFHDCFACEQRHRCGQTLSRDHYRKSGDLIICSHDYYMEHVWTYESRKREGQLPLLPEHSSVVFDEGHLLEAAAMKALGYRMKHSVFEELITRLLQNEIRESLALRIDDAILQSEKVFSLLETYSTAVPGSDRRSITLNETLMREVHLLRDIIASIEEELVFEGELYTLDSYQLRIVEEHLEMMGIALKLFEEAGALICWAVEGPEGLTLCVMPQSVKEVLKERVFSRKLPIVFSSATLSTGQSFDLMADSLGLTDYLSFSVASPYDYGNMMQVLTAPYREGDDEAKSERAVQLIEQTEGRALILFRTRDELQHFKQHAKRKALEDRYTLLFEGEREISGLISAFQQDEHSVLCAVSLWEGLDIPGPSLSNVMIWSLPFPPHDPVFEAKRAAASDPLAEVDLPYMLLRLRQGIGRLIRSGSDSGIVALLEKEQSPLVGEALRSVWPQGVTPRELA